MAVLLLLIAAGYLAGAIGWLRTAWSALERARGLAHQRRPADQWRSLAAKDAVGSLLFFGLAVVSVAEAMEGTLSATDPFLVLGVGPMILALRLGRRFERLSAQVAEMEDRAQRSLDGEVQQQSLPARVAAQLARVDAGSLPGVVVRGHYQPVEGTLGGDFLGAVAVADRLDLVVGDVCGHGLDAALVAMRIKDLLLAELRAGYGPARALTVANAFLQQEAVAESFATAFVAQYAGGVICYASAGHPPALLLDGAADASLPPTGPLLGVIATPAYVERSLPLPPGSGLVAFTDGLLEAYGPKGGLPTARIVDLVRRGGVDLLQEGLRAGRHEPVRDDIAVLEVRRTEGRGPSVVMVAGRGEARSPLAHRAAIRRRSPLGAAGLNRLPRG